MIAYDPIFGFHISCDKTGCAENEEYETDDFYDGWRQAQSDGWLAQKVNGEYRHQCPGHDNE